MVQRMPRSLDAHEIRVLGSLLEKEQATPEYYPLTENALLAACNQRTNRDPVVTLSHWDVRRALQRLLEEKLVAREESSRSTRWRQDLDTRLDLRSETKAALTVLLLRGPQTTAEVRARTGRLHEFPSAPAAEEALAELASPPDPLVKLLEREPGQKEPRWGHQLGGADEARAGAARESAPEAAPESAPGPLRSEAPELDAERVLLRLSRLEHQVQQLEAALERLRGSSD